MSEPRTVLITGCSSGFGRAMATEYLRHGWTVVATLRNASERLELFENDQRQHGERLIIRSLDVASAQEREALAEFLEQSIRRLDVLVNNAGYALFGALEDLSEEQIRRQLDVNLLGAMLLTRRILPLLRVARGRIINVSTLFGLTGFPLSSTYCASKFALEGWSESLFYELQPHGVQVALVEPGGHRTRFGEHIVWGERDNEGVSPYASQTAGYQRLSKRLRSGKGKSPARVAEAVVRLSTTRRMPMRSPLDGQVHFLNTLRRVLPHAVATALFSRWYGHALRTPEVRQEETLAPCPHQT